ncbi:non-ribosomal peptide synthetase [Kibdelosporangium aridum]|uniref:non-ribosomal peptide synthetase n=1 Tax=Kibdelosporangium aridum TaxID=2030 RepID=UPI0035E54137
MTTSGTTSGTALDTLLDELSALGVQLWARDGQLRFRAPQGVLTAEHREVLKAHRDELMARLQTTELTLVSRPDDAFEPFPLTDVQAAYLLGRTEAFDYGGVPCHGYLEVFLGDVAPEAVERAWNELIKRHGMLRAVIDPATSAQRVLHEVPEFRIEVTDQSVAEVRAELSHAKYDPAVWPLHTLKITRDHSGILLHVSVDLMVADFASVQMLLGELRMLLRDEALPPLDITFRDYVLGQRALRETSRYTKDREYWWNRIDELPGAPDLPVVHGGSGGGPVRFHRLQRRLLTQSWKALRAKAAEQGLTPSAVVLAAYAEVIGRWSTNQKFTVNMPLQNRLALHEQVCALIGDFTSVSLLAVDLTEPAGFADRARALGGQLLSDVDHRLCSGVEVIRELGRRRGQSEALMPVVFTGVLGASDSDEIRYGISQTPQVWVDCQAVEQPDGLLVSWDVRAGVFPDGLAEDAFGAFLDLLESLVDASWLAPASIELPAAQRERRAAANATETVLPTGLLHEPILRQDRDRVAVIANGQQVTYRELLARAGGVAKSLGQVRGEIVAVHMDKGIDQIAAVLGVLLAGGTYLPIDTNQPPARRDQVLADANVRTVLTEIPAPATFEPVETDPGRPAYVIYTSGSTGTPKGVVISHEAARNTIEDINSRFAVGPEDKILGLAQLGFDLSVYDIFGVLGAGGTLVLPDPDRRSDPSHWAELIAAHRVTLWNSVPAQAQMLADHLVSSGGSVPCLRLALLSGDWIPVTLPDLLWSRIPGLRQISLGGATEASIWSIHHPIEAVQPDATSIPYGKPLANQTFHVLDDKMRPRPDWVPGELYIGGAGVALGYLNDPGKTADRFADGLYRTGDLGRYLPDGEIEFLGRQDTQVKIRGHRIELAEIEAALGTHPGVSASAVVVHGEGPLHRQLAAFVEPDRHTQESVDTLSGPLAVAGASIEAQFTEAAIREFSTALDTAELISALAALRDAGLFADVTVTHAEDEVLAVAAEQHRPLLKRWLAVLEAERLLRFEDGTYRLEPGVPDVDTARDDLTWGIQRHIPGQEDVKRAWARVRDAWNPELSPSALIDYLEAHALRFGELMRAELDPVGLLFRDGRTDIAEAAYRDNAMVRYMNKIVASAVRKLAPRRILEVGAGVGATTQAILSEVDPVDYVFTDVSQFFLTEAEKRFPGLTFALFDIDRPPAEQGIAGGFDVIVCAGVLNNARHIGRTLAWLRELLAPGGRLIVTEPTREHYEVMGSQAFMMTQPEDLRAETGMTFYTTEQWMTELHAQVCLPASGSPLEPLGQHVFVSDATAPTVQVPDLVDHLIARLPEYMVPPVIQIVDALPLTANGKVDRRALAELVTVAEPEVSSDGEAPREGLEAQLAEIFGRVLGLPPMSRDRSFFQLGLDSLQLAQVAGQLPQEIDLPGEIYFDSLLRQLLHQPTIADLATYLRGLDQPAQEAVATSPIIQLGGSGDATVTVLVHEGIGTMSPYRELADQLAARGPVIGLGVTDVQSYLDIPVDVVVARRAADYADALIAEGYASVRLVGYCLGGLLAAEVANAFTERGGTVENLAVISSYPPSFEVREPLLIEHAFAKVLGVDPVALGYPDDEEGLGRALSQVLAENPGKVPEGTLATQRAEPEIAAKLDALSQRSAAQRLAALSDAAGGEHLAGLYEVFSHSFSAASRHQPGPYVGSITVVRPRDGLRLLAGMSALISDYWADVCLGDLAVVEVPGDHFSCMTAPHVIELAERIS